MQPGRQRSTEVLQLCAPTLARTDIFIYWPKTLEVCIGSNYKSRLDTIEWYPKHTQKSHWTTLYNFILLQTIKSNKMDEHKLPVRALSQVRICPSPLRSGHIYMKDSHSAESNEKSYFRLFRFLVFELCMIVFTIYGDPPGMPSTKKKFFKSGQIYKKFTLSNPNNFLVH